MISEVEQFVRNIRKKLQHYSNPERCAGVLKQKTEGLIDFLSPDILTNIDEAFAIVKASLEDVAILRRVSLIKERDDWYIGPAPGDRHCLL